MATNTVNRRAESDAVTAEVMASPETAKTVKADQERLLQALAEAGGKLTAEEDVIFRGTQIILPEQMDIGDAITFLKQKRDEDEMEMGFSRTYNFRPWDGALATLNALKKAFGMVRQKGVPSFFGEIPPKLITIPVGPSGETAQVPWGGLAVPLMPGMTLYVGAEAHPELGTLFRLNAEGPRKYRHHIEGVFNLVDQELRVNSLYRGKAFDGQDKPEFLDLEGVDPDQVIYSQEVLTQFEANVWALLRYTPLMRELGSPLKRAVLLEGPYGTGKTLGAYLTAKIAQENGWTFVYCRPGRDNLKEVMATARLYQPAVVFFEDVDTLASSAQTGVDHVAELLDIFDGVRAKGTEILCLMTTNHKEKLHKGMVRPGRLDAIISFGALDKEGIRKLAFATIDHKLIDDDVDWDEVATAMEGYLPAFVREGLDRAIRYNVARNGKITVLDTEDFVNAAVGLRAQLNLMEGANETQLPDELATAIGRAVRRGINGVGIIQSEEPDNVWELSSSANGR